jgi:hypothetical protein
MLDPHRGVAWDDLTADGQIDRLRFVVETMAVWLVQAQTGFGARDAENIEKLIEKGET